MSEHWLDEDDAGDSGPPDEVSDLWMTQQTAIGYPDGPFDHIPRPKRGPAQLDGQMAFMDKVLERMTEPVREPGPISRSSPWPVYVMDDLVRPHITSSYRRDKVFDACWCGVIHATGLSE